MSKDTSTRSADTSQNFSPHFFYSPWCALPHSAPLLSSLSVFTILACRNYYCYLAVCVIPHHRVRRRRPDTPVPPSQATVSRQAIFYISTLSEVLFTAVAFSLRCCCRRLERELIKRVASFLNQWQICSAVEPGSSECLWCCINDWMENFFFFFFCSLDACNETHTHTHTHKKRKLRMLASSQKCRAQQDRRRWNMVEYFLRGGKKR